MVFFYLCDCGYQTERQNHMKRHLNMKNSCTPDKDMKTIDIDTLLIGKKIRPRLPHLNQDEKNERFKQLNIVSRTKLNSLGNWSLEKFAKKLLHHMKKHIEEKNKKLLEENNNLLADVDWTFEDVVKLLQNTNSVYIIHDTILGDIEFPMRLTNGYFNTPRRYSNIMNNVNFIA